MFNQSGTAIIIYFEVSAINGVKESAHLLPTWWIDRVVFFNSHGSISTTSGCIFDVRNTTPHTTFGSIWYPCPMRRVYLASTGTYPKYAEVLILRKSRIFLPEPTEIIQLRLYFVDFVPILEKNTTLSTTLYPQVWNIHTGLHVNLVAKLRQSSCTSRALVKNSIGKFANFGLSCLVAMSSWFLWPKLIDQGLNKVGHMRCDR